MRKKTTNVSTINKIKATADNFHETNFSYDLKDYILVFENMLSNDDCDMIIKEYSKSNGWNPTRIGGGPNGGVVNKEIRNVDSIGISQPPIINENLLVRKKIDENVFSAVSRSIKLYNKAFNQAMISMDSGYDLLRYKKGGFYKQHCDSFTSNMRTISCSLAVNDNFSGGEFAFFNREVIKEVPKGAALLFPSTFLYPHEVMPVTKGTRYSIITWLM